MLRDIAYLFTQRMRSAATGSHCGSFCDRNYSLDVIFRNFICTDIISVLVYNNLYLHILYDMRYRSKRRSPLFCYSCLLRERVVCLTRFLQQPHQSTSSNSLSPLKLPKSLPKALTLMLRSSLCMHSSGRINFITPFFMTGLQNLTVIFP